MSEPADKIPQEELIDGAESTDRRAFFRVHDEVELEIQISSKEEEDATSDEVNELSFANDSLYYKFLTTIRALDLHDAQIAYDLKQDDAELHRYLQTINRKIELLARLVLNAESKPPQEADMSSGGIGFVSSKPYKTGEVVKVRIIFPKNYDVVYAFGHVVYCEKIEDEAGAGHKVGVKFSKISETNKRIMTRQVFKKQSENLRKARTEEEAAQKEGEQDAAEPEEADDE